MTCGVSVRVFSGMFKMIESQKDCYGVLDRIFPVGKEGLREIVSECFNCPYRKSCLQAALKTKEGLILRSEVLDRVPATGLSGKLRRWSEKKQLSRLIKKEKNNK
jgi:hypothetical protein